MSAEEKARKEVAEYLAKHKDELRADLRGLPAFLGAMRTGLDVELPDGLPASFEELEAMGDDEPRLSLRLTGDDPEALAVLVERAETDRTAWDACTRLAEVIADRGEALPWPLSRLAAETLNGRKPPNRKPGKHPMKNAARDHDIRMAVYLASKYLPQYSDEGKSLTACDVVAEELEKCGLHLSAAAVASIWKNSPLPTPSRGQ